MKPILSSAELRSIKEQAGLGLKILEVSLDLGFTSTTINLTKYGFKWAGKAVKIPNIREDEKVCYFLQGSKLQKVQFFSAETNLLYKLIPTSGRPLLQISGTSMHKQAFVDRIEGDRLNGRIFDAGTGLGYTAIAASQAAILVITIEKDPNVLEMAKLNPYSQELFKNKNIQQIIGDAVEELKKFDKEYFDFLILDGGTPKSSGAFFSEQNYQQAYRVLKKKGKLYHYVPNHHILRGRDFAGEVISLLKKAGFGHIERWEEESYLVAIKS